jgi:hypothetical protein
VNEVGNWIQSGQELTDKYIQERTPIMILALSKAAVRLAHVVEGIANALKYEEKFQRGLHSGRKLGKLFDTKILADPTFN